MHTVINATECNLNKIKHEKSQPKMSVTLNG